MAWDSAPGESISGDCGCGPSRRETLMLLGAAASAVLLPEIAGAMAGPFERPDFEKLVPADKKLTPQWLASLVERGMPRILKGSDLKYIGMPIGGIGAGQLYLGGDGTLWRWDIFNAHLPTGADRYAHPNHTGLPIEQGFELRITAGGQSQSRMLDASGFPDVAFLGQYPIGTIEYADPTFPVSVKLEAYSPFIPLNADDSSLPATVLQFRLTNHSRQPVTATLSGRLQNAVLINDPLARATRRNQIVRGKGLTFLACSVEKLPQDDLTTHPSRPDLVFENWNKESYDGWTVEGTAFGRRPARRSEAPSYMGDIGRVGDRFVNSHISAPGQSVAEKDSQTGTLTSKTFTVERDYLRIWIGGGSHKGKTCLNLLIDGKEVESITGQNSNRMTLVELNISKHRDKQGQIQIVDAEKGAWGNIGVGAITFTDQPAHPAKLDELASYGTMGLALLGEAPDQARATTNAQGDGASPLQMTAPLGEKLVGVLGRTVHLAPGESVGIDFVITWHFPNLHLDKLGSVGRHYASRFDSAQAVAQYVASEFVRLSTQTRLFRDTWYDSTLPHWLLDRTLLNVSTLATSTCYRLADGRFYAWEGVACCPGTCTHVWHYAHSMARLFPELERGTRERVDLKIAMHPDGVMGFRAEFDPNLAVDGQAGTILRCYREHQMSADGAFLKRNWPMIRRSFEPLLKLDARDQGLLEGAQMNTLDKPWFGKIAWLSSIYVAALRAGEQMAREMQDVAFAQRCRTIADRGSKNLVDQLFNGEYFANQVDPRKLDAINSGSGSEIDQVLGQSWAFQVGLERVIPREQTLAALKSLWKYNFTPDVGPYRAAYKQGRWYAMPGEAGLLMCTFPRSDWDYDQAKGKGPAWASGYFNECMNGFEHQVAGHMIWEGMVTEGLAIERAIHDRYTPARRNPWNEIECGDHYARSMASHGIFLAVCGFEYHGPRGHLAMSPRLSPDDSRAAVVLSEGWGTYWQKREGKSLTIELAIKWGKVRLTTLSLAMPADAPSAANVTLSGLEIKASLVPRNEKLAIEFGTQTVIAAGQVLRVVIRL